jgi:membrane protein DedA with SNARE-associated domain
MIVPWRQLPVVRNKISLVAGITELPFPIFLLYITLGTGLWSLLGISLGTYLGANWQVLLKLASGFSPYLLLITVSLGTAIAIVLYGRYLKTK